MTRCSPASHITDSRFYSSGYATPEVKRIFCDLYRYQRWLDVEAVLAVTQASLAIIPDSAARDISSNADIRKLDLETVKRELESTSHSLLPLLNALAVKCRKSSRGYIHYGATTQDIQDTAQVLEIRDVLLIVHRDLVSIMRRLAALVEHFKDVVTVGRTHTQDALPMTLGLKMAVWLDELARHLERLEETRKRILVSQLFGGVGTMDSFGPMAPQLLERFSRSLELKPPDTPWHNSRDRFSEFLNLLALICGTLAKIAEEIRGLSRSSLGEMEEPFHHGKIGSSTMPHKRNPEMCEQVAVLAKLVRAQAGLGMECLINEHERDYRAVRVEWAAITDSCQYTCSALSQMKFILNELVVHTDRIRDNVKNAAPLICSEALMFYIGEKMGKDRAHQLIYEAAMEAAEKRGEFLDILFKKEGIASSYSKEEIRAIISPESHVGFSERLAAGAAAKVLKDLGEQDVEVERLCPLASPDGSCSAA